MKPRPVGNSGTAGSDMSANWRISSISGALLAAYFIPTWTMVAFRIMISPIHGFYERPNIAVALFISDHLQLAGMATVRMAWLLALGKLTAVAFFAIFLVFLTRVAIRRSGGADEALAMALGLGSVISFGSMVMASKVGETAALRLHVRAALAEGGFTPDDIKEILLQQAIYCGVPAANHAVKEASAIIQELGLLKG